MYKRENIFIVLLAIVSLISAVYITLKDEIKYTGVNLYFFNENTGKLEARREFIPKSRNKAEELKSILYELISGPSDERLESLFKPDVSVQFIAFGKGGEVFLSLNWAAVESLYRYPALAVESLVKSIMSNIKSVRAIKILIDGVEPVSTFGNIKLNRYFKSDTIEAEH